MQASCVLSGVCLGGVFGWVSGIVTPHLGDVRSRSKVAGETRAGVEREWGRTMHRYSEAVGV